MTVFRLRILEKDPKDYKNCFTLKEFITDKNVFTAKVGDKELNIRLEEVSENEIIEELNKN